MRVYFFRHALIQDAAYGTLLQEPRQQIHASIVDTILEKFPRHPPRPSRKSSPII